MTKEISANTDNFKWIILNEEKAKKLNIQLLKIDEEKALLSLDVASIPKGMAILEYINFIQETGIVVNLSLNRNN